MARDFWGRPPIAIPHRGGDAAGDDQENTLAAFQAADKLGFMYGETDVILTADGHVAAIHGSHNWLQAYFSGRTPRHALQQLTLKEIRSHSLEGVRVTTLEELLTKLSDMRFFIDPKTDRVVLPLARIIRDTGAEQRVCVGSFDYDRVVHFKKILKDDRVQTSYIIGRGVRLVNKGVQLLKTGRLKDVQAVQLHHSLVSREMIDLVHEHGLKALVWTANSPLSVKNAVNCGADGVMSDHTELLMPLIEK